MKLSERLALLKAGYSKVRNRALTDAFIYMNLIDQYGSGIPRMLEEFRQDRLVMAGAAMGAR